MVFKATSFFVLALFVASVSFVSAQWIETPNFIEVTSEQAGSEAQGCFVANMAGMLASLELHLNNPDIIIKAMQGKMCRPDNWPPHNYEVLGAALHVLMRIL